MLVSAEEPFENDVVFQQTPPRTPAKARATVRVGLMRIAHLDLKQRGGPSVP
jgi:hypothetical protein